ncbi:MAG: 16S rRNA (adenine(1518)-N(6)/adenine(1519)-N(6))-dimethyltransferase RsmA [Gammaproteobacteria bacterium]|nr:16S rRNA (adenine(1518)-N(6)/adenine(1519)-N(6))-dimethyltransferase RsmA [Gammaproteobacteria bacterium]
MVFARKRFGQNFLHDKGIIAQIVASLAASPQDTVIEIGPGRGALTQPLLERLHKLTVIEIDRDLFASLQHFPHAEKLTAICDDVLNVDFSSFGDDIRLIGNLPYNISTPLMFHFLQFRRHIKDMVFMLQAEVVDRLLAPVSSANYGRLSVMFQYYCHLEHLLDVPPESFNPAPKVNSAVIALSPKHQDETVSFRDLEAVVAQAFAMRRKTLANNFKGILMGKTPNGFILFGTVVVKLTAVSHLSDLPTLSLSKLVLTLNAPSFIINC